MAANVLIFIKTYKQSRIKFYYLFRYGILNRNKTG